MIVPIPIPIGAQHIATARGSAWKLVSCEHCQQRYAYLLDLEAIGEAHDLLFLNEKDAAERARMHAEHNLLQKTRNCVRPIPCPNCGFYQEEMSRQLKEEAWINRFQVVGAVLAVLSFIPLAFDVALIWALTLVLAAAGLTLVAYGYVVAFRFDPNAGDAEIRKAWGRRHAVRGEQLDGLLAANPVDLANDPVRNCEPRA
jgi:hypothetical protein